MKTISSSQFIIILSVTCCRATEKYDGFTVYDIFPTKEQEPLLSSLFILPGFDVWRSSLGERALTVMVNPLLKKNLLDHLSKHGIKHSVYIENVASNEYVNKPSNLSDSGSLPHDIFSEYLSYVQINNYFHLLAVKYPHLVHVQPFGISYEKRVLNIIKISTGKSNIKKPIILIDAGIHAREWIAPAMALFIINQLVENEANRYLTEMIEWHICPLLNPDGYEYSQNKDVLWRKTRSHTKHKKCRGVDGNRNFDFQWMVCGASQNPCSNTYAGEKPFSETEIQALRDYVISIKDRMKLYLTFHSYGSYILYPWGYTDLLPPNANELQAIADRANEAQMRAGGPRYTVGSSGNIYYWASGASDDWVMAIANVSLCYTIEMPGHDSFPHFFPPPKEIRKYVTPFFEAVRSFGHYISRNESIEYNYPRGKGHTIFTFERNLLKDRKYIHTAWMLVIEFILQCNLCGT